MPSKSKSQKRFMAAAAHNPDFAKKAGIKQSDAKEWNNADKNSNDSNLPEKVKVKEDIEMKEKFNESDMRSWIDMVEFDRSTDEEIDDIYPNGMDNLNEAPIEYDAFADAGRSAEDFIKGMNTGRGGLVPVSEKDGITVMKNKVGTSYIAFDANGKEVGAVKGVASDGMFREEVIAGTLSGVVYRIYMDILSEGMSILSDNIHSPAAIRFWQKLIMEHTVYVVGNGEILGEASPQKFHKYWSTDENSPSAELQFLLVE